MKIAAVLLAAGQGTRMHSALPKTLHPLLGRPMAQHALEAAAQACGQKPVVVVGYGAPQVMQTLGETADYVTQEPQLGTGHAVQQAERLLAGQADLVVVTFADMPLLRAETLQRIIEASNKTPARSRC